MIAFFDPNSRVLIEYFLNTQTTCYFFFEVKIRHPCMNDNIAMKTIELKLG